MTINTSRKAGFTLVEIMIVVAIIGLLAAIAIPNFVRARTTSQKNACINNLRQIDGAIQQYALETKLAATRPSPSRVTSYLKQGAIPRAPLECSLRDSYTIPPWPTSRVQPCRITCSDDTAPVIRFILFKAWVHTQAFFVLT